MRGKHPTWGRWSQDQGSRGKVQGGRFKGQGERFKGKGISGLPLNRSVYFIRMLTEPGEDCPRYPDDVGNALRADFIQFPAGYFIIEVNHAVSVAGHLPENLAVIRGKDPLLNQHFGNLLVFRRRYGKALCQKMTSQIQERFQSPAEIGFRRCSA